MHTVADLGIGEIALVKLHDDVLPEKACSIVNLRRESEYNYALYAIGRGEDKFIKFMSLKDLVNAVSETYMLDRVTNHTPHCIYKAEYTPTAMLSTSRAIKLIREVELSDVIFISYTYPSPAIDGTRIRKAAMAVMLEASDGTPIFVLEHRTTVCLYSAYTVGAICGLQDLKLIIRFHRRVNNDALMRA